jgi:formylglycine-generating enzyme required for sulfatase activity
VVFQVTPANTRIYLPGLQRELSLEELLPIGKYRIEFSAPDFQTERMWLDVAAGDDLTINLALSKQVASLQLSVWPPGASMTWLDHAGKSQSLPVRDSIDIELGQYQLTFAKPGYLSQTSSLDVNENRPYELSVKLSAVPRQIGEVFADQLLDGSPGPQMVVVPAGGFLQGDNVGEGDWQELPTRKVNFDLPFAMGQSEVTCADYKKFIESIKRVMPNCLSEQHPITRVSLDDATAYAKWLSVQTGEIYQLPTESQWEYAARAGSLGNYSGFDELNCNLARYGGLVSCDAESVVPVKQYPANAYGLYDMHGNVWEWTIDCATEDYSLAPVDGSAAKSDSCHRAILRGGSYMLNAHKLRVSYRSWRYRDYRHDDTGFRLVRLL